MPGVVRTAAVSSLVVSGAYGRVSAHFTWLSPIAGSALSSNDLVNASWTSSQRIISPSFSLCASSSSAPIPGSNTVGSSGLVRRLRPTEQQTSGVSSEPVVPADDPSDCGDAVWPNVSLDETSGEYTALLSIPPLNASSSFYLLMKSDLGDTYQSPAFDIDSDLDAAVTPPATMSGAPGQGPNPSTATTFSTQFTPKASGGPLQKPQPIGPIYPPNIQPPSSAPSPTRSTTPAEAVANAANKSRHMIAVAVAVPLSLVALAAVIAACFAIGHKKSKDQSVTSSLSLAPSLSNHPANGDGFTMLPRRTYSLSKSNSLSEKLVFSTASSSECLLPPLHQYQPYVMAAYAPQLVAYQPHATMPTATGRPLTRSESVPVHSVSNVPSLYPTIQTPVGLNGRYQPVPAIREGTLVGGSHLGNAQVFSNPTVQHPVTIPAVSASNIAAAAQSQDDDLVSRSLMHITSPTQHATPVALLPGGSGNQGVTSQGAFGAGTTSQLTPPATDDDSAAHHMTMQKILNSYMARQADVEYRESKPIPPIPFEPVDLDAVWERERKEKENAADLEGLR